MPLAANALTTLEAVKADLRITHADDDVWLTRMINRLSTSAERYCGRPFGRAEDVVEDVRQDGQSRWLYLRRMPIESVASVELAAGGTVAASEYRLAERGTEEIGALVLKSGTWPTAPLYASNPTRVYPDEDDVTATVTYTGGYVLPKDGPAVDPAVDLPPDIEDAVIAAVADQYLAREAGRNAGSGAAAGVKSERLLDAAVSYFSTTEAAAAITGEGSVKGLSARAIDVLDFYRIREV